VVVAKILRVPVLHDDEGFDVIREHHDCVAATGWPAPRGSR